MDLRRASVLLMAAALLGTGLGLAAVSVIAVMLIQFESFVEPLIITLAAPVSFVGALVLLIVTKTVLNVSSLMGLILLVGLIVGFVAVTMITSIYSVAGSYH